MLLGNVLNKYYFKMLAEDGLNGKNQVNCHTGMVIGL